MLNAQYTEESYAEYAIQYRKAKELKENATTQEQVNEATSILLSAKYLLRKAEVTVTLVKVVDYEEETVDTFTKSYGEEVNINLSDYNIDTVEKWTVTDDTNKTTTKLATSDTQKSFCVTSDIKIMVYVADAPTQGTNYSKVVFVGKNNSVVAIKYVAEGASALDTSTVSVPSIPFYASNGWDKDKVTYTGKTIYVHAQYTSNIADNWCIVHFEDGTSKQYSYDGYVYLTKLTDESKQYALYSDSAYTTLLSYLSGNDFYVPYIKDVYVKVVDKTNNAVSTIMGSFAENITDNGTEKKSAVFNCKFYLPETYTVKEWGIEVTSIVDGVEKTTIPVKAETRSSRNEYSVRVKVGKTSSITAFKARAYVKYTDENGTLQTLYSDYTTQSLNA